MDFAWKDAKLESLLDEAEKIGLVHSYSCCALLRMIVERTVDQHIRRSKQLDSVKAVYIAAKASEEISLTQEQIDGFEPTLRNMIDWLNANPAYFPSEARKECTQALAKFSKALTTTINGAMHQATIVSDTQIKQVRNDVYPLLKFLLETKPTPSA